MKANIIKAHITITTWYDSKKQKGLAFKEEHLVMLDSRHIRTKRLRTKLDHKKIGLFRIEKVIGNRAFRPGLPPQIKV